MRPTICLVTPEFPPARWGGLARTALRVAEHANAMGLDVHVLHFGVGTGSPLLDECRITTHREGITLHHTTLGREPMPTAGRSVWDCPHTLTLQTLFENLEILDREQGFDAFVSFFLYPTSYVVGLYARRERKPHVACLVGNDVRKYFFSPEKVAVCRHALENADRMVFLAQDLLDLADCLAPVRDRSHVVYNSVRPSPLYWPGPGLGSPFRVGAAGIFKHAKGLPYLLKALALLRRDGDIRLELAGETRPEEVPILEKLLEHHAIRDVVTLHGVIAHEDMPAWLCDLDAFALPSLSEGCPNVLMEAMAVGLPCVASRVGACAELMEHGASGLLVPWGDASALASALARLRDDPELAASLGGAAQRRMALFSCERERQGWERVLREVLQW